MFDRGRPLNLAHRGARDVAPENTLAAFRAALDTPGCDGVELDVMLSADGKVVVIHDFTLDKTTNGIGLVGSRTLAELKQLDAGSWRDPRFTGERIPTLQEVLDLCTARIPMDSTGAPAKSVQSVGIRIMSPVINIELKSRSLFSTGLEARVVELVERNHLEQHVMLSSFDPLAIWRVKRLNPSLVTGLLHAANLTILRAAAWLRPLVRPDALHPVHTLVTPRYMRWAKARSYPVVVWTVNDPGEMRRLADLGVDAIITDRPDLLAEVLRFGHSTEESYVTSCVSRFTFHVSRFSFYLALRAPCGPYRRMWPAGGR